MENIIANPQQWQNVADCLKSTNQFTQTIIQNVCDGSIHYINNGFWDYVLIISLLVVGFGLFSVFILVVTAIIKELFF